MERLFSNLDKSAKYFYTTCRVLDGYPTLAVPCNIDNYNFNGEYELVKKTCQHK